MQTPKKFSISKKLKATLITFFSFVIVVGLDLSLIISSINIRTADEHYGETMITILPILIIGIPLFHLFLFFRFKKFGDIECSKGIKKGIILELSLVFFILFLMRQIM
jgi:hypothetical protein